MVRLCQLRKTLASLPRPVSVAAFAPPPPSMVPAMREPVPSVRLSSPAPSAIAAPIPLRIVP